MADDNFRELERELGLFLRRAHAASAGVARDVHPDLEPAAYELLALISATPVVRASDLAAHIGVGRGTMSRQLSRLESLGFIARRPDPEDFRGQLLTLTEGGRERLDSAQAARRTYLRGALDAWGVEEITDLTRLLGRLNSSLAEARRQAPTAVAHVAPIR